MRAIRRFWSRLGICWPWLSLGLRGEIAAARLLRRAGFRILAHSYECPLGEIDLITLDATHLVFVEVRTRSQTDKGEAWQTIGPAKQRKLSSLATYFQKTHPKLADRPSRFDVVSVTWPQGSWSRPTLRHIEDAFSAQGPWR